jgi:hypothetical protein
MNWARNKALALIAGLRIMLVSLLLPALVSCGGDSGISLGDGQSPDPVVVDYPIFYVKRQVPLDEQGAVEQNDFRELLTVQFGADLYMRTRASSSALETNLTESITTGLGDVRDVSVSYDGTKVLFSLRGPMDPDAADEDQPSWNIWEYDVPSMTMRRILLDDITAEEGQDVSPMYLPDGRILFSSTRQNRSAAKLLDQGKPQFAALDEDQREPAFVLHVMDDDGGNLTQTSFNQSHDLYPSILGNGRVVFSRWDGMIGNNAVSLYHANPDGTDLQLLYGADSHDTGTDGSTVQFVKPREMPDGRIMALLRPFSGTSEGADLVIIDTANYLNNTQPNVDNQGILTGPAQEAATVNDVRTVPGLSPGGRFASAWPLWDGTNRVFVSWSLCQLQLIDPLAAADTEFPLLPCTDENLQDPLAVEAQPAYGIWLYDLSDDTQLPVVVAEPGFLYTDVAVAQPRTRPVAIMDGAFSGNFDPNLINDDAGILKIRSVYDMNGVDTAVPDIASVADPALTLADERPARFLRLYKAVGIPDEITLDFDNSAFGVSVQFGMREIVGYAPVEPDGSVMIKIPADVPMTFDVLDKSGRRIGARHNNWLQVRPGETLACNGCHANAVGESHGRSDAFASVYAGAAGNGVPFPNTDPLAYPTINIGETMAEARANADPAALEPSIDLAYDDVWTYPTDAGRPADASFVVGYADLLLSPPPEIFDCYPWTARCRVLINYEDHIQPLWDASRPVIDPVTLLETDNHRCTDCHALRDSMNELIDPAARGQLELTATASAAQPLHYVSYRELLFGDFLEEIRDGAVQDVLTDQGAVDLNGDPILEPVGIGSPLSAGGANSRPAFFARFAATGAHPEWLSPAELRLISEWLDLGGQYYNNPFDAPVN